MSKFLINQYVDVSTTHEFLLYNYKIKVLTDIPYLINYIKRYFSNIFQEKPFREFKEITLIFFQDHSKYKLIRQDITSVDGFTEYNRNYECTFSSDFTTVLVFSDKFLDSVGYYAILNNVLKTLLKINGFAFLHASCFTNHKDSFIATGSSGMGKTTILISAVVNGLKIVSDSCTMISQEENNSFSVTFPCVKSLTKIKKDNIKLNLLDFNFWEEKCIPTFLMFLEKVNGECLQWYPISKQEALIKLLTANSRPFSLEYKNEETIKNIFNCLHNLISQTKSGILKIGQESIKKEISNRGYLWKKIKNLI